MTYAVGYDSFLTMVAVPHRDRQAERRKATRDEILTAAWEIARERSLAEVTLREVAARIGMAPPSLYTHVASKHAVLDAMFGAAWTDYLDAATAMQRVLPTVPRAALQHIARHFFDFAVADLARFQLMNQRTIPDFTPTPEAYAPAVEVIALLAATLRSLGLPDEADRDLFVAIVGGLVDAQLANDPHGSRWSRLLPRAIDMYADAVGLPTSAATPRPTQAQHEGQP